MRRWLGRGLVLVALIIAIAVGIYMAVRFTAMDPFEERVERAIITTLQRESPESFLVTGRLDLAATVHVQSTRIFLPDVLDIRIGRAEARVRVPGSVSYGFDVASLEPRHIDVRQDGTVYITLPELAIYAVDPKLDELEIETRSGWLSVREAEGSVTQEAIRHVRQGLERQAQAHLSDSVQPRVNTARALRVLLEPVLMSAGIEEPKIRMVIADRPTIIDDGGMKMDD